MKFAIVDGQKREALPGLQGTCQQCDALMIPKCGRFRIAHWAHSAGNVEHHKEPETEWHRHWKDCFPVECQEVRHQASDGKRHVADVRTRHGRVIEFQHSPIAELERASREQFYQTMYWVVNGQRLKLDRRQFFETLRAGEAVKGSPLTFAVSVEKCMLLRKWAASRVFVFFDFGEIDSAGDVLPFAAPVLWGSMPNRPGGGAFLRPIYRRTFLEATTIGQPLEGIDLSKGFEYVLRRKHGPR